MPVRYEIHLIILCLPNILNQNYRSIFESLYLFVIEISVQLTICRKPNEYDCIFLLLSVIVNYLRTFCKINIRLLKELIQNRS